MVQLYLMSPEAIAIGSVGVGLSGLMLAGLSSINRRFDRVDKRLDRANRELTNQGQRLARLEGILTPRPWEDAGRAVPHEREAVDPDVRPRPGVPNHTIKKQSG